MTNTGLYPIEAPDQPSPISPEQNLAASTGFAQQEAAPQLLTELLRLAAQECREEVKVVCDNDRLSYTEIDLRSDRLAGRLIKHGVRPGDRVLLGLPNSADFVIASFAIWKAGAVLVALDPCIRAGNLHNILESVAPSALIAELSFAAKLRTNRKTLRSFRAFYLKGDDLSPFAVDQIAVEPLQSAMRTAIGPPVFPTAARSDDVVTITFTSGSTGEPKGVMHTHESILACAGFTLSYLQLSRNDVMMLPLPLHHVLAFRRFLTCFLARCTLVLTPNIFMMKQFVESRPTGLVLVPSGCGLLIDNFAAFFREHGECLRYVEIGSEPISPERLHALQTILPMARLHVTYGLTEGRVGYLNAGLDGSFNRLESSNYGLEIRLMDSNGSPVQDGEPGEIVISGSGLFKGYWGDSLWAHARLREYGFRTGDMGAIDEDGRIRLLGRIDDMIKIAGHKINPRQIEMILQRHTEVAEAVVIGEHDRAQSKEVLRAFVVRKKESTISETELIAHCRAGLELYKIPASICFRESFPKTPLGKIQRHLVAQLSV